MSAKADAGIHVPPTAAELALIYAKLAVVENQKENGKYSSISAYLSFDEKIIDLVEKETAGKIYEELCALSSSDITEDGLFLRDHKAKIGPIIDAMSSHQRDIQRLHDTISEKLESYQLKKRRSDFLRSEIYRFRENMVDLPKKLTRLQELCRHLQKQETEVKDSGAKMLSLERESNEKFRVECLSSTSSIREKMQLEVAELAEREAENENLKVKLAQFKAHLDNRREQQVSLKRTKELEQQLAVARSDQRRYHHDQLALKNNTLKSHVLHTEETIESFREQIALFNKKFVEFDDTLARTDAVITAFSEQEVQMKEIVRILSHDMADLQRRAAEADVALIRGTDTTKQLQIETMAMRTELQKLEGRCRELQLRRKQLMENNTTLASSSSSSSSSSHHTEMSASVADEKSMISLQGVTTGSRGVHGAYRGTVPPSSSSSSHVLAPPATGASSTGSMGGLPVPPQQPPSSSSSSGSSSHRSSNALETSGPSGEESPHTSRSLST